MALSSNLTSINIGTSTTTSSLGGALYSYMQLYNASTPSYNADEQSKIDAIHGMGGDWADMSDDDAKDLFDMCSAANDETENQTNALSIPRERLLEAYLYSAFKSGGEDAIASVDGGTLDACVEMLKDDLWTLSEVQAVADSTAINYAQTKAVEEIIESEGDIASMIDAFADEQGNSYIFDVNGNYTSAVEEYLSNYLYNMGVTNDTAYIEERIASLMETIKAEYNFSAYLNVDDMLNDIGQHTATWDPRLYRLDSFMLKHAAEANGNPGEIQATYNVPFASASAASMFMSMTFNQEAKVLDTYFKAKDQKGNTLSTSNTESTNKQEEPPKTKYSGQNERNKLPFGSLARYYNTDPDFIGASALMNPYAITRLIGSFSKPNSTDGDVTTYMYDIRDQRRFYNITDDTTFNTQISSPTITHIIEWANKDRWGRTPYAFQDFVYSKWYGKIPNNRLITLRRYHAPTYDNLLFDGMEGTWSTDDTLEGDGFYFAPRCTVISYIGEDTGNTFGDIMKFTTGIPWEDAKADLWDVSGEEGDDHQAVIDGMFMNDSGVWSAEKDPIKSIGLLGGTITAKILSFGKMATAFTDKVGLTQEANDRLLAGNMDPYNDGTYENRIKGPLNRIASVKKRSAGITFQSQFNVKCTYVTKSIGGINPKAAMLDILANCLEMVSPNAVFWGGGHKFMIKPKFYPFHDHGWRDNFMERLYLGKIFGTQGVIATTLKGVRDFGTKKDANGNSVFSWDNITSQMGGILGQGLSFISGLISTVSSALFGESSNFLSDILDKGSKALGMTEDEQNATKQKALSTMSNLFTNLNTMWHSKVLAQSTLPQIQNMHALLLGAPVGEWHLTVGNPLNPIMVVGNLICTQMDVSWGEELGPDDFPTELTVTYSLEHGMARDKAAIQSMFNRGMGPIYSLPDYMRSSSDFETHVDEYSGSKYVDFREPAYQTGASIMQMGKAKGYMSNGTYQTYKMDRGSTASNTGNPNTETVPKFNGLTLSTHTTTLSELNSNKLVQASTMPVIKALAVTRKFID